MKRSLFLLLSLPFLFLCQFTGSMYNPDDPSYIEPSFTIDMDASDFSDGDTVASDTLRITLNGNDDARYHNQFRWLLDDEEWTKWEGEGKAAYEIILSNLSGGTHTLAIEVCYNPDEEKTDSTITFFRAIKPVITAMVDTILAVDAEKPCTLWVEADGTGKRGPGQW